MASLQAHSIPRGANVLHAAPRRQAAGLTTRPPAVRSLPPVRGALHAVASQGTASRVAQPFGGQVQLLPPFKLERYFAKHEFSAPYQLCNSDRSGLGRCRRVHCRPQPHARCRWTAAECSCCRRSSWSATWPSTSQRHISCAGAPGALGSAHARLAGCVGALAAGASRHLEPIPHFITIPSRPRLRWNHWIPQPACPCRCPLQRAPVHG